MGYFRWVPGAFVVALVATGCGSGAEDLVRQAAQDFESAVTSGEPTRVCDLLTEEASRNLDCAAVDLPHGDVREVSVWGDAAQVRVDGDTLFLREKAAGWRISGAGCRPRGDRPYECEVGGP